MNKIIVLTGGGSAGHVLPNLPIASYLKKGGHQVHYIGSKRGIERGIVEMHKIEYHTVRVAKYRRYFSWRTLLLPFDLTVGILKSIYILYRINPNVLFSKGGFVAVPPVIAAFILRVPVVIHESDRSPGLANRLCAPFAKRICTALPLAWQFDKKYEYKKVFTGIPMGEERNFASPQLITNKLNEPYLLVFGGSQGATAINQWVWMNIEDICNCFNVIHVVGHGNMNHNIGKPSNYEQYEYVADNFSSMIKNAQLVISRAGMNTLVELLHYKIPALLIPLPRNSSRGDQIENSLLMQELGVFKVISQELLSETDPKIVIKEMVDKREEYLKSLDEVNIPSTPNLIVEQILEHAK